jgi:hypothetical protein
MAEVLNPWGVRGSEAIPMSSVPKRARSYRARIRPYELRINGSRRGAFEEIRDAVSSAHIGKQECPFALITVADRLTGNLVAELAP